MHGHLFSICFIFYDALWVQCNLCLKIVLDIDYSMLSKPLSHPSKPPQQSRNSPSLVYRLNSQGRGWMKPMSYRMNQLVSWKFHVSMSDVVFIDEVFLWCSGRSGAERLMFSPPVGLCNLTRSLTPPSVGPLFAQPFNVALSSVSALKSTSGGCLRGTSPPTDYSPLISPHVQVQPQLVSATSASGAAFSLRERGGIAALET